MHLTPSGIPLTPLLDPTINTNEPPIHCLPPRPTNFPSADPFSDSVKPLQGWKVYRHVFPAAFPRTKVGSSKYNGLFSSTPKQDNDKKSSFIPFTKEKIIDEINKITQIQIDTPFTDPNNKEHLNQPVLWVVVNRYVPPHLNPDGLTMIFCHAAGFVKETWEPTIADILQNPDCPPVADIWAIDDVFHGDSAILNRGNTGMAYSWSDNGRDILNFILRYLPPTDFDSSTGPIILERQPLDYNPELEKLNDDINLVNSCTSPTRSWRGRNIVGIGHSLGGAGTMTAASALHCVYSQVIVVDPVPVPKISDAPARKHGHNTTLGGAISRRDNWPNLDIARQAFLKNKNFFGRWRRDALERYLHFGLVSTKYYPENRKQLQSDPIMELRTPKIHEALVYSDNDGSFRLFDRILYVSKSLPATWIFPAKGSALPAWVLPELKRALSHGRFVHLPGGAHLLPLDVPEIVAAEIVNTLNINKSPGVIYPTTSNRNLQAKI